MWQERKQKGECLPVEHMTLIGLNTPYPEEILPVLSSCPPLIPIADTLRE